MSWLSSVLNPKPVIVKGARLDDLRITSSAYGKPIPIVEGTYRLGANVIWSTELEEEETRKKTGGKGGGGGQVDVSYSYYASFALGFCEGIVDDVSRMWADGKLVYDKTGTTVSTLKEGLTFRFYPGDETQVADSLIVADKGADAPAFRGLCYVVFDRVSLADYGNRIPNFTVELNADKDNLVAFDGDGRRPTTLGVPMVVPPGLFTSTQDDVCALDWDRGYAYATTGTAGGLRRFTIGTMEETKQITYADIGLTGTESLGLAGSVASDGGPVFGLRSGNSAPVIRLDPVSLIETARFGTSNNGLNNTSTGFVNPRLIVTNYGQGASGRFEYAFVLGGISNRVEFGILSLPDLGFVWDAGIFGHSVSGASINYVGLAAGQSGGDFTEAFLGVQTASAAAFELWKFSVEASAGANFTGGDQITYGVSNFRVANLLPADLIPGETVLPSVEHLLYDQIDNNCMTFLEADSDGARYVIKIETLTGNVLWRTRINSAPNGLVNVFMDSRLNGSTMGWMGITGGSMLVTSTGELLLNAVQWDGGMSDQSRSGAYDAETETWVGHTTDNAHTMNRWFFNRLSLGGVSVGSIVKRLCARVGLEGAADIDTIDIDADTIPGYAVLKQVSARKAIEPLAENYFFDGVESDWIFKFLHRGQASIRTITQDELFSGNDGGEYVVENRVQEVELPSEYSLFFVDVENDFADGFQFARRISLPAASMSSKEKVERDFTAAVTSTFAKQVVEKSLFSAWQERDNYAFGTAWTHIDLDPTDRITLSMDSGDVFEPRITEADFGQNFLIQFKGPSEDAANYDSSAVGYGGDGVRDQGIRSTFVTKLFLLDTPLLRDVDEPPSRAYSRTYFYMGGYGGSDWVGASLYKSLDNASYAQIGRGASEMTWGTTMSILGDPPLNGEASTDEVNSVRITLTTGDDQIASVTQLEMLNRSNAAVLIKSNGEVEVIQYRDVTQESDGTFTLSGLLRGRRGTDTMASGHTLGEPIVILDPSGDVFNLSISELNTTTFFKAVGTGQSFDSADVDVLASTGRSLKPWAPVHPTAISQVGDDVLLECVRRTRIGGPLQNFVVGLPLNEDTESYDLEIINPETSAVVRTESALTTPSYLYDAADIITDLEDVSHTGMLRANYPLVVKNSGAERGTLHWADFDGMGTKTSSPDPFAGDTYFYGGDATAASSAYQGLTVPAALEADVDNGDATFKVAWQQNGDGEDSARIDVEFFDASMVSTGTSAGTDAEPSEWTSKSLSAEIPANTRFIRVTMVFTRVADTNIDAYIDAVSALIRAPSSLPTEMRVRWYQLSAQIGRGFSEEATIYVQ